MGLIKRHNVVVVTTHQLEREAGRASRLEVSGLYAGSEMRVDTHGILLHTTEIESTDARVVDPHTASRVNAGTTVDAVVKAAEKEKDDKYNSPTNRAPLSSCSLNLASRGTPPALGLRSVGLSVCSSSAKSEQTRGCEPLRRRHCRRLTLSASPQGIVGLPNVGKSSLFNLLCDMNAPAENLCVAARRLDVPPFSLAVRALCSPFCTIDPNESRCAVPDDRYDWLCNLWKPPSEHPAYLQVTDILGHAKRSPRGSNGA